MVVDNFMSFFKAGHDTSSKDSNYPSYNYQFDSDHEYTKYFSNTEVPLNVNDHAGLDSKLGEVYTVLNNFVESRAFLFYIYTVIVIFSGLTIMRLIKAITKLLINGFFGMISSMVGSSNVKEMREIMRELERKLLRSDVEKDQLRREAEDLRKQVSILKQDNDFLRKNLLKTTANCSQWLADMQGGWQDQCKLIANLQQKVKEYEQFIKDSPPEAAKESPSRTTKKRQRSSK